MTVDSSLLQSRALRFGSVTVRCARTTAQPTQSSYIRWRKKYFGQTGSATKICAVGAAPSHASVFPQSFLLGAGNGMVVC